MSEWSVPSGMTPQDNPKQPRDGFQALYDQFHAFRVEVRDKFNNLLKQAGIRVEKDLVRFTGAVRIEGTLDLPAGIIGNDALASPVVPAAFHAAASNFAVSNTEWSVALEHSLTTPAGFTQAVVTANAWARILNTSGGTAGFGTLAQINNVSGPWDDESTPVSQFGNLQATYSTLVTGLTEGETIPIRVRVFSSPALSADPDNEAAVSGVVLWLR